MTDKQKLEIAVLRKTGLGYRIIGKKMNIPSGTIKSYCQKYNLRPEDIEANSGLCPVCGKKLIQLPHTKKKKFCSAKCCTAFWYLTNTSRTCLCCGKAFAPSRKERKYCSHECYINARYYGGANAV